MKYSKSLWPNLITLSNLSLGMVAILLVTASPPKSDTLVIASFLIMFAAFTDRLDGKIARKLNAVSELGKELDSLADLVSFGIAPIVIAWKLGIMDLGWVGFIVCTLYPLAGAFRLARYNVSDFDSIFTGMPITIAGALLSLVNLVNCFFLIRESLTLINAVVAASISLLLSVLMISNIKIEKR